MNFTGTVYAPPELYVQAACALALEQNGNNVTGAICNREAGTSL